MYNTDALIVGSSISGLMAAAYLRHRLPDVRVTVLGPAPEEEKRPIVGESLVEPAILFFRELGLGDYLDCHHVLKNGLTFYHKLRPDDPLDRRYSVHAPHRLHCLSRQLKRPEFDRALYDRAAQLGAEMLVGTAGDVRIGEGGAVHQVQALVGGAPVTLLCRWLLDASGRKRVIGKKVSSYTRPRERQRSAFWFRLADFEPFLPHIEMSMRRPLSYDPWLSTHHFMGRGNWIWGIPLAPGEHRRLISVGITYRPDVFPHTMRSLQDFLAFVDREHPAVSEMVRSGKIIDTHIYHHYLYWADRLYSPDGWFLLGDAARAVDPLYSTGMSMSTVQIQQIAEIIRRQREGGILSADIQALEDVWTSVARRRQLDISDQYATMGDPFQACMRRYWNLCGWFNAILPLWWNGFFTDPDAARLLGRLISERDPATEAAWRLFEKVSRDLGPELEQSHFDQTEDFDYLINPRFDCKKEELPLHLARMFWKRAALRLSLVRMTRYRHLAGQLPYLAREILSAGGIYLLLGRLGRKAFEKATPPLPELADQMSSSM